MIYLFSSTIVQMVAQSDAQIHSHAYIEKENGGYIIFNHFNDLELNFYFDIDDALVLATDLNNVYSVDDYFLQIVVVKQENFKKSGKDVLKNYVMKETEFISSYLKEKLYPKLENIILDNGIKAKFWYFEFPLMVSTKVTSQQFIIIPYKEFIIGVNTTQFGEMNFDDVKQFLFEIVNTIKFSEKKITFEYLKNIEND